MTHFLGIDGCRGGWIICSYQRRKPSFYLTPSLQEVLPALEAATGIFIDIPIGLPTSGYREADLRSRSLLKTQGSSIFPCPPRAAVSAGSHEQFSARCKKIRGKGASIQSWNIVPKIIETDSLLLQRKHLARKIFESHPELCFLGMLPSPNTLPRKKEKIGQKARTAILAEQFRDFKTVLSHTLSQVPRSLAQVDDILDAAALASSCALFHQKRGRAISIPARPPKDEHGLPMRICSGALPRSTLLNRVLSSSMTIG